MSSFITHRATPPLLDCLVRRKNIHSGVSRLFTSLKLSHNSSPAIMPMSSFRRKRSNKTSNGSNNNSNNNNSNERVRSTTRSTSSGGKSAENNSVESGGYAIKPLSTVGDSGKPSHSVANDLRRVVNFIQDERHLVAHELYEDVKSRLENLDQIK